MRGYSPRTICPNVGRRVALAVHTLYCCSCTSTYTIMEIGDARLATKQSLSKSCSKLFFSRLSSVVRVYLIPQFTAPENPEAPKAAFTRTSQLRDPHARQEVDTGTRGWWVWPYIAPAGHPQVPTPDEDFSPVLLLV